MLSEADFLRPKNGNREPEALAVEADVSVGLTIPDTLSFLRPVNLLDGTGCSDGRRFDVEALLLACETEG